MGFAERANAHFGTVPMNLPSTNNVLRVYAKASVLQHEQGVKWYVRERDYGRALADTHWRKGSPRTLDHAIGIMAALSPMVPWDYAKQLALQCYRERGLRGGHFGQFVSKANLIYEGADPRDILGGPKVRSFYQALSSAGTDPDVVVVDRHAAHVAMGDVLDDRERSNLLRQTISRDGYQEVSNAYRRAARELGDENGVSLTPSQLQAIVWVTWRAWLLGEEY